MSKHVTKCQVAAELDASGKEDLAPHVEEAAGRANESLLPRAPPQQVLDHLSWMRAMGFSNLYGLVAEKVAKVILRPNGTQGALANARDGIGPGFFDEAEDLRTPSKEYAVHTAQVAQSVCRMLRQYAPDCIVYARPQTPFFAPGAWLPGPPHPEDVGPAIPRPGCTPLRITGLIRGGGWVWVRRSPSGGVLAVRFPFHRAAIETLREVSGSEFSTTRREWCMKDGSDAAILLAVLRQVIPTEDLPRS